MKFLILNGSLKQNSSTSNTRALCNIVKGKLGGNHDTEIVDLSTLTFEPGVDRVNQQGEPDDLTQVLQKILLADSVIFATPIWWGQASSLIQAVMERMTWFDDWYIKNQINALYGKTFGLIVSGTDDGWQQIYGQCYSFASILGFTVPPESAVGVMEQDPSKMATDSDVEQQTARFVRNMLAWTELLSQSGIASVQSQQVTRAGVPANSPEQL
jgi:multimeric flavodoxin WrbA